MNNYEQWINIASSIISEDERVSTAQFPWYFWMEYETFIFRKKPWKTRQIFHRSKNEALKVHKYIVDNLTIN